MSDVVTINDQGRVVIPKDIRQRLNLAGGQRLEIHLENGRIVLTPQIQQLRHAQALIAAHVPGSVSLADELIQERRAEAERE
ncbi:MAG: AbrB/MazE/SpoVT family DNA-binding domain-containing protein [Candidatus Competibacteraceae bacterium]|nr:AbrB/MazE/SpoVT family DNA-binding domain-containing protein [Candidatus Competibacteraceae bacterium]